jgi:hypothetical protein
MSLSPFVKLPNEIKAIISGYYALPISLSLKEDIISYAKINQVIEETPIHEREELYNKFVFWLNIQGVIQSTQDMHPIDEIQLLLFSPERPKSWTNPVYKRQFHYVHGMYDLSDIFFYYINNNPHTFFGEKQKYCSQKFENKIRIIWGLFNHRERLQFLFILPFFVGVETSRSDYVPP